MNIFLEGPDATGKSNLAERMSKMYDMKIAKFSYPKDKKEQFNMYDMYVDFISKTRDSVIDRCWYSEMIYGPIIREGSSISIEQMYQLEQLCADNEGAFIIHCNSPMDKLWKRFKKRGDDYIKEDFDTVNEIRYGYERLMHSTAHIIPVVRYEINERMPKL